MSNGIPITDPVTLAWCAFARDHAEKWGEIGPGEQGLSVSSFAGGAEWGRAACAALVRAAGCLADDGESGEACWVHDFHEGSRRARTPEEHDPRCPQALAAAIEARRG